MTHSDQNIGKSFHSHFRSIFESGNLLWFDSHFSLLGYGISTRYAKYAGGRIQFFWIEYALIKYSRHGLHSESLSALFSTPTKQQNPFKILWLTRAASTMKLAHFGMFSECTSKT